MCMGILKKEEEPFLKTRLRIEIQREVMRYVFWIWEALRLHLVRYNTKLRTDS